MLCVHTFSVIKKVDGDGREKFPRRAREGFLKYGNEQTENKSTVTRVYFFFFIQITLRFAYFYYLNVTTKRNRFENYIFFFLYHQYYVFYRVESGFITLRLGFERTKQKKTIKKCINTGRK